VYLNFTESALITQISSLKPGKEKPISLLDCRILSASAVRKCSFATKAVREEFENAKSAHEVVVVTLLSITRDFLLRLNDDTHFTISLRLIF
jgi:hypothetical protein